MIRMVSLVLLLGALVGLPVAVQAGDDPATDTLVAGCRVLIGEFQTALRGELMAALSAGGPAHAISVCQVRAPEVAAGYSQLNGWSMRRAALRTRNPQNAATSLEAAAMIRMASDSIPEVTEWVTDSTGHTQFHYLSAIPMMAPCLTCHGAKESLPDTIRTVLAALYPDDQAVDFKSGELRGAFSITVDWPQGRHVADSLWKFAVRDST